MKRIIFALLPILLGASTAAAQMGPNLDLSWNTFDAGGGTSTGGVYTLVGTVGQFDAGGMTSGNLTLLGGFWGSPSIICYPDCNGSGTLTIADFGCFQSKFAANDPYADCNQNGTLTIADFGCFQSKFAAGCP